MENQATADYSIAQLRQIVSGAEPTPVAEPVKAVEAPVTEAAVAAEVETAPATEPEKSQEQARGEDGKFEAKAEPAEQPGVAKRIGKALAAQRAAEHAASEATRRATELQSQLEKLQGSRPATEHAQPVNDGAPKKPIQADFADFAEYEKAQDKFLEDRSAYVAEQAVTKALKAERERVEKTHAESAKAQRDEAFAKSEDAARKKYPDYDATLTDLDWPKAPGSAVIADYLMSTGNADLMYQLQKHPETLEKIAALHPMMALAALGKFEAGLEVKTSPAPAKPAVKLPTPPATVGGTASPKDVDLNALAESKDPGAMRAFKTAVQAHLKKTA